MKGLEVKVKTSVRVTLLCLAALLLNCTSVYDPLIQSMADDNCEIDAKVKVSKSRKVLLFVSHHIYVDGASKTWDPSSTTKNQYGTTWNNQDLVNFRTAQIKKSMAEVNRVFKKNSVNIVHHDAGYDVVVDPKMIPSEVSYWNGALGHTLTKVNQTAADNPKHLHVHWSWTAVGASGLVTAELAVGQNFYVVVTDNPKGGDKLSPTGFAHEIVHALGYETHESASNYPTNLMLDQGGGDDLHQGQIQVLWNKVNSESKKLSSLSCDA